MFFFSRIVQNYKIEDVKKDRSSVNLKAKIKCMHMLKENWDKNLSVLIGRGCTHV